MDDPAEYTAQERAALAAWLFAHGWAPTTRQAGDRLGLTSQGAHYLLQNVARVVPIYQADGHWRLVDPPSGISY